MLEFRVSGQTLKHTRSPLVVADSINYLEASFVFSDEWDGMTKWAVFVKDMLPTGKHPSENDFENEETDEDNRPRYHVLIIDDKITADTGINLSYGMWTLYIHGDKYDDAGLVSRITTNGVWIKASESGIDGANAFNFTEDESAQIIAQAISAMNSAKEFAENAQASLDAMEPRFNEIVDAAMESISDEFNNSKEALEKIIDDNMEEVSEEISATRDNLVQEIQDTHDNLISDIQESFDNLATEIEETKEALVSDMQDARDDLTEDIQTAKSEMEQSISDTKDELISSIDTKEAELTETIEAKVAEINVDVSGIDKRVSIVEGATENVLFKKTHYIHTGDFFVPTNDIISDELYMSELTNGQIKILGKNQYNNSKTTGGTINTSNGADANATGYIRTEHIPVYGGRPIIVYRNTGSASVNTQYFFYDSLKRYLGYGSGIVDLTGLVIELPETCEFIRFVSRSNVMADPYATYMIEYGTKRTGYVRYSAPHTETAPVNITLIKNTYFVVNSGPAEFDLYERIKQPYVEALEDRIDTIETDITQIKEEVNEKFGAFKSVTVISDGLRFEI